MNKKYKYISIDVREIINLTLFLTAENENRYIIDNVDIERFLKTFKINLKKQNVTLFVDGERLSRNTYYSNTIQKISYDHTNYDHEQYLENSPYFILKPWYNLNDLGKDFAGGIPYSFIKACYQDKLYQNLPPRSDKELKILNDIYINYLNEIENPHNLYNHRNKQIVKQKK